MEEESLGGIEDGEEVVLLGRKERERGSVG